MQTIEAIYQNGMFKPLNPISESIAEGERVRLTIEDKNLSPDEMLELAGRVYEGLSEEDIDEIEKVALDRSNFEKKKAKYTLEELLAEISGKNLYSETDWGAPVGKEAL